MASLTSVDDFLNFTQICSFCKKKSKTILLSCYSYSSSQCILIEEEKKKFSFMCSICCSVNQLDFTQMCNEYTVKFLQNKTLQVERVKIEQALIKLKLQEQIFLIIYTKQFIVLYNSSSRSILNNSYCSFLYLCLISSTPSFSITKNPICCFFLR